MRPVSLVLLLQQYAWLPQNYEFLLKPFLYLFIVDSLDYQRCGWRPRPALLFATVPIISFTLSTDSAFSITIFAFHFRPVITEGWAFFTSGLWESRSIWESCALPNLNSSASDNVGSLSFVDELYSATFVKVLGTTDHFSHIYWLTVPFFQLL